MRILLLIPFDFDYGCRDRRRKIKNAPTEVSAKTQTPIVAKLTDANIVTHKKHCWNLYLSNSQYFFMRKNGYNAPIKEKNIPICKIFS